MSRADPRAGILAFLGATALVLIALVVFARFPTIIARGREYRAEFTSVAGLSLGDDVRYGGLPVGTITSLQLAPNDPTRLLVKFRVKRSTPVKTDTRATITQLGLLGEPYLNLQPGSRDAPVLPAGSLVPSENTLNVQDALSRLAGFLDRADTLLKLVERASHGGQLERLDRTLVRIESLVETTTRGSEQVFGQMDRASARLTGVLDRTERLISAVDTTFRAAGPGLSSTQREASAALRELRVLLADTRDALQQGGGLEELVRNLSVTSENMAKLTSRLEQDPTSVLRRRATPKKTTGPALRD
jgi:phospholipid/cholesterol/gamma-HCH transport system substrate-binding protein